MSAAAIPIRRRGGWRCRTDERMGLAPRLTVLSQQRTINRPQGRSSTPKLGGPLGQPPPNRGRTAYNRRSSGETDGEPRTHRDGNGGRASSSRRGPPAIDGDGVVV